MLGTEPRASYTSNAQLPAAELYPQTRLVFAVSVRACVSMVVHATVRMSEDNLGRQSSPSALSEAGT